MIYVKSIVSAIVVVLLQQVQVQTAGGETYNWVKKEMAWTPDNALKVEPQRDRTMTIRLDSLVDASPPPNCDNDECFGLYYYVGKNFDKQNSQRKNILFIAGGPGAVPPKSDALPNLLEGNHNVVYFHPRGVGLSRIPKSNDYDKFLRAEFIVADIEQVRKRVLGPNVNWDAIYGLSYGTVIAQMYAWSYPTRVEKLILDGPVARHKDTESARKTRVFSNLDNIYKFIRSSDSDPCDCTSRPLIVNAEPAEVQTVFPSHNFCFLRDPARMKAIRDRLEQVYDQLEWDFGSIGFVTENYAELKTNSEFTTKFPYPQEFFLALRELQQRGAPQGTDSLLFGENVNALVGPAFSVGYWSMFDRAQLLIRQQSNFPACVIGDPFFQEVQGALQCAGATTGFCFRVDSYERHHDELVEIPRTESLRGLYVLGVYGGMNRWVFRILKDKIIDDCLTGADIDEFAQGTDSSYRKLREQSKKIGIVATEKICPWNPGKPPPGKSHHQVQTLMLVGGADPVIAGCQAEDFFNDGLAEGRRVFIEFPGMGHFREIRLPEGPLLNPSGPESPWATASRLIIEKFLSSSSIANYRNQIMNELLTLKAVDRTPAAGQTVSCPS
jgi:pimeloyl-ACP methyl ester carboxylesterase